MLQRKINFRKKGRFCLWLVPLFCFSINVAMAQKPLPTKQGYRLGPEDVLEISVWEDERLTREVLVRPDGMISFPLVGEVEAAGKTVKTLKKIIVSALSNYIPDPTVLIGVKAVHSYKIYVIGKVNRPGVFVVGDQLDIMQALTLAGGLTPFAAENEIKILRRNKGDQAAYLFRYGDIKNGTDLKQNVLLISGDIVVVP